MERHSLDPCERLGIWPVRIVVGGLSGWSLWFGGDVDVLLSAHGKVPLYEAPEELRSALLSDEAVGPDRPTRLTGPILDAILEASPAVADIDAATAWFARADRKTSRVECEVALDGMNMVADIASTVGDESLLDALSSAPIIDVLDRLTMMLTFLGQERGLTEDPDAISALVDSTISSRVEWCARRAASYVLYVPSLRT